MKKVTLLQDKNPSCISAKSVLDEMLREGARKMLQEAIEAEVAIYVQNCQELRDQMNRRIVKRNGYLPREIF
jgi:putative transposase